MELGRGMLFPDSWAYGAPDPPPARACLDCGDSEEDGAELDAGGLCWDCRDECDGVGTCIGEIPGRDGETGYYQCAGCPACEEDRDG